MSGPPFLVPQKRYFSPVPSGAPTSAQPPSIRDALDKWLMRPPVDTSKSPPGG
jgi:hypothetical protein